MSRPRLPRPPKVSMGPSQGLTMATVLALLVAVLYMMSQKYELRYKSGESLLEMKPTAPAPAQEGKPALPPMSPPLQASTPAATK